MPSTLLYTALMFKTADMCDRDGDTLRIAEPVFRHYGLRTAFKGPVATVKVFEDNVLVRAQLEQPGGGRVLVVDGGGSLRCALVGDQMARLALENGWSGIIVYGCIRDAAEIAAMDIGVRALNTHPLRSTKRGEGQAGIPVHFAGVTFTPGALLYADIDGIVIAPAP